MKKQTTNPLPIPPSFPVEELKTVAQRAAAVDPVQCGTCGRYWDDAVTTDYTPAPSARCPFEAFHDLQPPQLSPNAIHQKTPRDPARPSIGYLLQSMREKEEKPCKHCGQLFTGIAIAEYCSQKCRDAVSYRNRKARRKAARANARNLALAQRNAEDL